MTKKILFSIAVFFFADYIYPQIYPNIDKLDSRNIIFKQFQEDIEYSNRLVNSRKTAEVSFYEYIGKAEDSLIKISARCGLSYDTIATCNSLTGNDDNLENRKLILPTVNGLFIPSEPKNFVEILLEKQYNDYIDKNAIPIYIISGRKFFFIQNARFDQASRAFFLDSSMKPPLEESILTSSYGMRISPISGKWKMHNGIDLAAPKGTPVFSCNSGIITEVVENDYVYGNYIVITHKENITSLYAHLSEINVTKNQIISSGTVIGKVGSTGLATGPHLHFEVRINGESTDPEVFF